MPSKSQSLVRRIRSDVGDNAPDFTTNDVAFEIIGNANSTSFVLEIHAFDDSEPGDSGNEASVGETTKVPIGSTWFCHGARTTNKWFMKTAASTWTLMPTSAAT